MVAHIRHNTNNYYEIDYIKKILTNTEYPKILLLKNGLTEKIETIKEIKEVNNKYIHITTIYNELIIDIKEIIGVKIIYEK